MPELRLPALQVLGLNANQLTGGLGPIRGCTALQKIFIAGNQLTGDLSALANCKNLKKVFLCGACTVGYGLYGMTLFSV